MLAQSLYFTGPQALEIREEKLSKLGDHQVLVETRYSAISAGTELLIYNGHAPEGIKSDNTIAALSGELAFPLKYGYACVGKVIELGKAVEKHWQDQFVFAFNPHESHFVTTPDQIILVPDNFPLKDAVFLPNMETAVNLVMDGNPMLGEKVAILGQGIVGLLTTAILAYHPIAQLITFDRFSLRRDTSLAIGAHRSLMPETAADREQTNAALAEDYYQGSDLIYELSGNPQALNHALELAGYNSRIVVGSWYGSKQASLNFGEKFHRERIKLISSQVSTIAPELSGRWDKQRRFQIAWEMLRQIKPSKFITHLFALNDANSAYDLLVEKPETCLQVVFEYGQELSA